MKVQYDKTAFKKDGKVIAGGWIIRPDCACRFPLIAQDAPVKKDGAFTFDGNFESPTFNPSMLPYADRCDPDNHKARCHFFVRKGVAHHCPDSKYPNAALPLLELNGNTFTTPPFGAE